MNNENLNQLLYEALETEMGGVQFTKQGPGIVDRVPRPPRSNSAS
jgi:hypothetical protein